MVTITHVYQSKPLASAIPSRSILCSWGGFNHLLYISLMLAGTPCPLPHQRQAGPSPYCEAPWLAIFSLHAAMLTGGEGGGDAASLSPVPNAHPQHRQTASYLCLESERTCAGSGPHPEVWSKMQLVDRNQRRALLGEAARGRGEGVGSVTWLGPRCGRAVGNHGRQGPYGHITLGSRAVIDIITLGSTADTHPGK